MPSPITHHHALGIHPGAFVQPTAPNTADVQDGVLWVDTSREPPYPLKCWDLGAATWRLVGAALPRVLPGSLLFGGLDGWTVLPAGDEGQTITVHSQDGKLVPTWDNGCCAPAPTLVKPGGQAPQLALPDDNADPTGQDRAPGGYRGDQYTCGAAVAMGRALVAMYGKVTIVLNIAASAGVGIAVAALAAALADGIAAAVGAEDLSAGGALNLSRVLKLAGWALSVLVRGYWATISADQENAIIRAAYCALPHGTTSVDMSKTMVDTWRANIEAVGSTFGQGQVPVLKALLEIVAPSVWQKQAVLGMHAPSATCADWTCTGGAIQGGVLYTPGQHNAVTGGALFSVPAQGAITGGAQFVQVHGNAMTGGAT